MSDPRTAERIDPEAWLVARGWQRFQHANGEVYWRQSPNEDGWVGGWNTSGAVHRTLEAQNVETLKAMGLYQPPARRRSR